MSHPERPQEMQAVVARAYGTSRDLELDTVPVPTPAQDQVLVRVIAASLNRADKHLLHGAPMLVRLAAGLTRPKVPVQGRDLAGVVVSIGPEVTNLAVGDRVVGEAGSGLAEFTVAREDVLATIPEGVSFAEASTLPIAGVTALKAVRTSRAVPGSRMLIHGASGGVGSFAIQVAVALGADVTASCSAKNAEIVRKLGASQVLDYTRDTLLDPEVPWDAIIDCAGTLPYRKAAKSLKPGGVMARSGFSSGPIRQVIAAPLAGLGAPGKVQVVPPGISRADLDELAGMVQRGDVFPYIEHEYGFADFRRAYERLESSRTVGKSVVRIAPDPA